MRGRAAAGGTGTVRGWIARLLCVVLLIAGAVHTAGGHTSSGHGAAGGHGSAHAGGDVAGVTVIDLHCHAADHADAPHHADADICAVAPSCALAAADLAPGTGELPTLASPPAEGARQLTGRSGPTNPDPPRSLEA